MIVRLAERNLKTKFGDFRELLYYNGKSESIALVMGEVEKTEKVFCRIHSECLSAHIFNSIECDCREQMEMSQKLIQEAGKGIIIWHQQEGRGNGHLALICAAKMAKAEKIPQTEAYERSGFPGDSRNYMDAAFILKDLNVSSVVILTNNPDKSGALENAGVGVAGMKQVFVDVNENVNLKDYYADKIKQGHLIHMDDGE